MHFRRSKYSRHIGAMPAFLRRRFARRAAGRPAGGTRLHLQQLEPRLPLAGVVINEFLALNSNGITDEDGDRSDWIELHNTESAAVNVGGWFLADSQEQWQLPSVEIPAGGYLLVFASGKNRGIAGEELHANFNLSGDGELLALLMPDGTTVVDAFDPFPPQVTDVSYGRGAPSVITEPLVGQTEAVHVHVPTSGVLGTTWTATDFVPDATWLAGDSPIGYERSGAGIDYTTYFEFDVNSLMPEAQNRDTIYMRIPFSTADLGEMQNLTLRMLYDDGFVAYLNGHKIAERNAPASPAWDSAATSTHSDSAAIVYESISINEHLDKLVEGTNVLAVHGLNSAPNNRSDFLIGPMLLVDRGSEGVESFMSVPTPGGPNQEGTLGFVADTTFSMDRGFYDAPFTVEITTATPEAQIRYTLDGSEPTATFGLVYDPASPPLITTTTALRAAAFKSGFTPTNIDTQTYIFLDDVLQQDGSGLPPYAPWSHFSQLGIADADWAMDPEIVNHPLYAGTIKDDLRAVDSVSVVLPWNELFGVGGIYISGKNIERGASIELISPSSDAEFQIDGSVEIMGQTSPNRWNLDKLSFRVTFKQPYGPTDLNFPLFTDPFFDKGTPVVYDTFVLDAVYNHSWAYGRNSEQRDTAKFIQDQFVADLQNLAGGHGPHGRYIHLYLNGLYWGMYYLHERPDDVFAASYFGGDNDDYDVIKHVRTDVVAGDGTATANYDALLNAVRQNMTVPANYEAVQQLLAIDEFIDYMIINYYVGNHDWALNTGGKNWYATYNRVDPNGRWRFHSWDAEHVLESLFENRTFLDPSGQPTEIQHQLMESPEYRLRFADRVQALMHNGGILTPETAGGLYAARMQHIDRAIVGESARWGDNRREPPYTREDWLAFQNEMLNDYFPNRTSIVLGQFNSRGWLVPLAAPTFSQAGGTVEPGYMLTLSKPPGAPAGASIYYTLDGSDPRDPATNLPSASALLYTSPIVIDEVVQVNARIYLDAAGSSVNEWSPIIEEQFFLPTPFPVRITELHYNPAPQPGVAEPQDLEFVELKNVGSQTVNLAGMQITQFATAPYSFGSFNLAAGERYIVARNPAVFQSVYGTGFNLAPTGYGNANLSNGGEPIALLGPLGETLQEFEWDDEPPWPTSPDGGGYSLHIIDPLGDSNDPANWRASVYPGGSPGAADLPLPGDYDANTVVDAADGARWRASFGQAATPGLGADGNGDGVVDAADYVLWRRNLPSQPAASVSEPVVAVASASLVDSSPNAEGSPSTRAASPTPVSTPLTTEVLHASFVQPHRDSIRVPVREAFISREAFAEQSLALILLDRVHESVADADGNSPLWSDLQQVETGSALAEALHRTSDEQAAAVWDDDAWLQDLSVRLA